jgi:hypothetical protein
MNVKAEKCKTVTIFLLYSVDVKLDSHQGKEGEFAMFAEENSGRIS